MLLDLLADWAEDEQVRRVILVDNPERLFGSGLGGPVMSQSRAAMAVISTS